MHFSLGLSVKAGVKGLNVGCDRQKKCWVIIIALLQLSAHFIRQQTEVVQC